MAGKPGGLEINVIWITFDLVSLLPPGLHDQTGAGHGLRLGSNQRISPLLPHDLCHLLRRPGEPSVRVSSKVESPGYEALAQGEKVGQPFLGVLLHTSRAATEKK